MRQGAPVFEARDREALAARGIPIAEAERQLACFREPPPSVEILRPCALGDGIEVLRASEHNTYLAAFRRAADAGRFAKFVPASGAASRMFGDLVGDEALERFRTSLERFPFWPELSAELSRREELPPTSGRDALDALLDPDGLDYGRLPKALMIFHRPGRTPFDEQLVEAAAITRDATRRARAHFTIAPGSEAHFEAARRDRAPGLERDLDVRLDVSFSIQEPGTDTLSVDEAGRLLRGPDGALAFWPGGNGALLRNLAATSGDLVFVKNIDNVVPPGRAETVVHWKRLIAGRLVVLEGRAHQLIRALRGSETHEAPLEAAFEFWTGPLGGDGSLAPPPSSSVARREWLLERLDRPLRVCGVVRNEGEPGGIPCRVRDPSGTASLQIVESPQIDRDSPEQVARAAGASHFNPVDVVCALRDVDGRSRDLDP